MKSAREGILLVANYSNKTGYAWNNIYRLFGVIAEHFSKRGYSMHVSFASLVLPVTNFPTTIDLTFHEYNPEDPSLSSTIKLLRLVKQNNIKYIYYTDQRVFDYRYAWLRWFSGVKKIIVHSRVSVPDPNPAEYERGLKGAVKALLGRWDLICANRIYAVSDFVKNRLIKKNRLPEHKVVKILNGIDIVRFRAQPIERKSSEAQVVRVFTGGRATHYKGIHVLIQAAAAIRDSIEVPFEIRYAGDGPYMEHLQDLVTSLSLQKQFIFLGELSTTHNEVITADIIVVPSIWGDACPSAVSEALASGVPLIATAVGGVPEMIGEGKNALLVSPNDIGELSKALMQLIHSKSLREEIGSNGRARAEEVLEESVYHLKVIDQLHNDFEITNNSQRQSDL